MYSKPQRPVGNGLSVLRLRKADNRSKIFRWLSKLEICTPVAAGGLLKIGGVMRLEVNSSVIRVITSKVSSSPSLHHLTARAFADRVLRIPDLAPGQSETVSVLTERQQHLLQPIPQLLDDL